MLEQAGGLPIRVASKSVRSTAVLRRILDLDPGFRGVLAFTVPEALYLAEQGFEDIVVAYPTVDREAIAQVARLAAEDPARAPVPMVDDRPHLDLIEGAIGGGPSLGPGLPRRRRRLVAARRTGGADRPEALAGPRCRAGAADGRGDRRAARHLARRADGLRGADRRRRRPDPRQPGAQRRDPRDAGALRARHPLAAARDRRRGARGRRAPKRPGSTSSTAAAPGASRAPGPPGSSPSSPPARASTRRRCSTTTARWSSSRPPSSASRWSGARWAGSRPSSAAATWPPGRPTPDRLPEPYLPGGLRFDARRAPARCRAPLARRRRLRAAHRRPRLPAPREGGRALRALRPPPAGRGRDDRRRGPHLPRRGQGVPLRWARIELDKTLTAPIDEAVRAAQRSRLLHPVSRFQAGLSSIREGAEDAKRESAPYGGSSPGRCASRRRSQRSSDRRGWAI